MLTWSWYRTLCVGQGGRGGPRRGGEGRQEADTQGQQPINRMELWAWNHTANVHLATTSPSNEFKFWGITFL